MQKTLLVMALVLSSYNFAQDKSIKDSPKFIEESMQKAGIRMDQITGYRLEYHIKSDYKNDNLIKRESFAENGDLVSTEIISYNDKNEILSREVKNNDDSLIILYTYEYSHEGYVVTKSENDVIITKTEYILDLSKNIISEKENNLLEEGNLFIEKTNEYKNNFLIKTNVKYNNGNYSIVYKNNDKGNPIEEEYLNNGKKLINKFLRKYDTNNNLIEETTFDANSKVQNITKILYEYDTHKNWTKRTQYASKFEMPISNTIRTIRYN
ncbi:hypothetical protein [Chishuiella sp.]|uniref:hypothetical protein n=1 Tax=Chishuiella sp. TaxID=1969467 RepID=UPI0028A7EEC4|nr:hypothetical protein [Chishuiella sp.]